MPRSYQLPSQSFGLQNNSTLRRILVDLERYLPNVYVQREASWTCNFNTGVIYTLENNAPMTVWLTNEPESAARITVKNARDIGVTTVRGMGGTNIDGKNCFLLDPRASADFGWNSIEWSIL